MHRRRWLHWMPAILYLAAMATASSLELAPQSLSWLPLGDKGLHVAEYAGLGFLLAHACLRSWPRHHRARTAGLALLLLALWALWDEVHQSFVPGRTADVLDLMADAAGAVVGISARLLASWTRRWCWPAMSAKPAEPDAKST